VQASELYVGVADHDLVRAELRVYRLDGSLQCVALVDQWDEFFHWTGMNHRPMKTRRAVQS
jgi:hypothetical protein